MLLQHMQTKFDKKIQLFAKSYFHPHPLMFTFLIYHPLLLVHKASCLWCRKGIPLWMCLASEDHKRDGVCLGLRDQNVQTLAMFQFQDLAYVVCRGFVVEPHRLEASTIKWDGQAYRRCPAASLTVPALSSVCWICVCEDNESACGSQHLCTQFLTNVKPYNCPILH